MSSIDLYNWLKSGHSHHHYTAFIARSMAQDLSAIVKFGIKQGSVEVHRRFDAERQYDLELVDGEFKESPQNVEYGQDLAGEGSVS